MAKKCLRVFFIYIYYIHNLPCFPGLLPSAGVVPLGASGWLFFFLQSSCPNNMGIPSRYLNLFLNLAGPTARTKKWGGKCSSTDCVKLLGERFFQFFQPFWILKPPFLHPPSPVSPRFPGSCHVHDMPTPKSTIGWVLSRVPLPNSAITLGSKLHSPTW